MIQGEKMELEKIAECIEKTLLAYRMSNMFDEEGENYPLVDLLSTGNIETGKAEIDRIVEYIYQDLLDLEND